MDVVSRWVDEWQIWYLMVGRKWRDGLNINRLTILQVDGYGGMVDSRFDGWTDKARGMVDNEMHACIDEMVVERLRCLVLVTVAI